MKTSAEVFELAFRNSPAMQSIVRLPDGVIVEANETFGQVLGFHREEVVGKTALELNFWVSPEKLKAYREQLIAHRRVRDFELEAQAKDGTRRTLLLSSDVVDIDGIPHAVSAGVDITGRKEIEARLRQSELRLRESDARFGTAFQASPVFMTIGTRHDGRFVEVNDAFVRKLGLTREEAIGRNSLELELWESAEDRKRFHEGIVRTGSLHDVECRIRCRDGTARTMQLSAESVQINQVPHLLTFGVDITERKRAEVELQNALAKERELNQLKSDFVSLVSHEFRTPLEIIMSSVDNLDRYHDRLSGEKRGELLRVINKSVRRMAGMMEEVLLLGRFDSGGTEFNPTPLDLSAFCHRVRDEMESATQRRCPIAIKIAGDLTGAHGDETVLRHVLTNLLSNAVKYSAAGETVEFTVRRDGSVAVMGIADRGCGIPEVDRKRLFQAFHRGSNVRQIPGTGLGLLIVQRCVDLHRGEIAFESTEGEGTVFTVRLPLFAS